MLILLQFIIGPILIFIGWAVWYARRDEAWKQWIERTFLDVGDDLFAEDMPYSGHVRWMRYVSLPAGLAIVIPTAIFIDIILGMIATGIFWWMSRQKSEHDDHVRQDEKLETG